MIGFRRVAALLAIAIFALTPVFTTASVARAWAPVAREQDEEPVNTLEDVESAVIQIEAVGSFLDPEEGLMMNVPGFGSGFIIDPSGIAVTNNHVVTGGALFRIFVSGRDKPVNARVLGVSECYDLAVIDLQGEGYPYLEWSEDEPRVTMPVYAAGFPLGDPEYALTSGIISKDDDSGESDWASIDYVLMHDAKLNPGNSGGPLVNEDGQVVGVNYAADDETDQNWTIPAAIARDVVETLRSGTDVASLGINGSAIEDDASYIYVYSVATGSPADLAGIQAGDYVLEIEGLAMGVDGLLTDYCDVIGSHDPVNDVLSVVVYRPETDEVLEGQINGRPLESSFAIGEDETTGNTDEDVTPSEAAYEYESISNDAGTIYLEVPTDWDDRTEREWTNANDKVWGTQLIASPDLDTFFDEWEMPGVIFSFSDSLQDEYSPEDLLDTLDYSEYCDYQGRKEWPGDSFYSGAYDEYLECGGADTTTWVVALMPETGDYMLQIEVYATTEADLEALDHILDTFYVEAGAAPTAGDVTLGEGIFNQVDVEGLEHEYTFLAEPFFGALIPSSWEEVESADWIDEEDDTVLGKYTLVSPDISKYEKDWSQEGLQAFILTDIDGFDTEDAQDAVDYSDECTYEERETHEHTIYGLTYSGHYDVYSDCGGTGNLFYSASFVESKGDHAVLIDFVSMSNADDEAWEVLLESFFLPSAVQSAVSVEGFATVSDETGRISLSVPTEWTDSESEPWEVDDEIVGIAATFSSDVGDFNDMWDVAGVYVNVWDEFGNDDADEVLDTVDYSDDCTYDSRFDYEGDRFTGKYDLYTECGGVDGALLALMALFPVENEDTLVLVELSMPAEEDRASLEPVLDTLQVLPTQEEAPAGEEASAEEVGTLMFMSPLSSIADGDIVVLLAMDDGTASISIESESREISIVAVGTWEEDGDLITLYFDMDEEGNEMEEPVEFVLEEADDGSFVGVEFDEEIFGDELVLEPVEE